MLKDILPPKTVHSNIHRHKKQWDTIYDIGTRYCTSQWVVRSDTHRQNKEMFAFEFQNHANYM